MALSAMVALGYAATLSDRDWNDTVWTTFSTEMEQGWNDQSKRGDENEEEETTDVINWSGTHKVTVSNNNYWEPDSVEEVEEIVRACHDRGQTVRPLGSSLSPNGIALNKDGMISMANIDRVLDIDTEKNTITVEAGMPVSKVCSKPIRVGAEHLNPVDFTRVLPVLSTSEQQSFPSLFGFR